MKRLIAVVGALIALLVVAGGAAGAPGGEKGKPESTPNAPQGTAGNPGSSQGQANRADPQPAEQEETAPADSSEPESSNAEPESSSNAQGPKPKSTTHRTSAPKKTQNAGTGDNPQGRGPSGKTQYCHATHSETNPYVLITTNNNALPAHRRHQDEEDIIPATNGTCPGGTSASESPGDDGDDDVSGKDRDDLRRVVPGADDQSGVEGVEGLRGAEGPRGGEGIEGLEGLENRGGPDGVANGEAVRGPGQGDVLGASQTSPGGSAAAPNVNVAEERADDGGSLPFTGLGLAAVLAAAALALASGIALRRVAHRTDV